MSFDAYEQSIAAGRPLRFYQFAWGNRRWNYAAGDMDALLTIDGEEQLFKALRGGLLDDGIRQTGQPSADMLVITAPALFPVAALFRVLPPAAEIALTVFDKHVGDDEVLATWVGSVAHVGWPSLDKCKISCQSLSASMETIGLRLTWSRDCPHSLGDRNCRVDIEQYKVEARITSMDGAAVTVMPVLRAMRVLLSVSEASISSPGPLQYTVTVENLGNVELADVAVVLNLPDGSAAALLGPVGDSDSDELLGTAETWAYTGSYSVTEADIAAGVDLVATVVVAATGADSLTSTATTAIGSTPAPAPTPVSSTVLVVPSLPARLPGGFVLWYVEGERDRRGITSSAGNVLALMAGTFGLLEQQTVWVYPGCPGTMEVCLEFGNSDNYGGVPKLPGKSPFDGTPIF